MTMHENVNPLGAASFMLGTVKCSTCTIAELHGEVRRLLLDRSLQPRLILDVNAHIYNLATQDPDLARVLNSSRVTMADGMGIVWAARLFGERISERCNETEAFRAFLADGSMPASKGIIAGTTDKESEAAAAEIARVSKHLRITRTASGYLSEEENRRFFREAGDIDFIFLGHSTPITQRVADMAVQERPDAIVWGIGAGTIKILAGTMQEAPAFWRRTGLQWLYRLCKEPGNLWKRYLVGNPLFVLRVLRASLSR
ncbi:MAG TPA: WecB/TagA/CpsF family glycosyltransferase [Kiritimatiellia bacterium]|jgi:exopolysaccharide biosynthesis WecB/TagA/CpsF family protein